MILNFALRILRFTSIKKGAVMNFNCRELYILRDKDTGKVYKNKFFTSKRHIVTSLRQYHYFDLFPGYKESKNKLEFIVDNILVNLEIVTFSVTEVSTRKAVNPPFDFSILEIPSETIEETAKNLSLSEKLEQASLYHHTCTCPHHQMYGPLKYK